MKVHTYSNFDGRAKEAFDFYRFVFGGESIARMTMAGGHRKPKALRNRTEKDYEYHRPSVTIPF